jgi:hypothetical protein
MELCWWQILPLTEEVHSLIAKNISSAVHNPIEALYKRLMNYVKKETFSYLESRYDIREELIDRMTANEITINDLSILKKGLEVIKQLVETNPDHFVDFLKNIGKTASMEIKQFRSSFPPTEIFTPNRENSLKSVEMENFEELARTRIVRYIGMFDFALGSLQLEKKTLMSGSKKQQMTEWWLTTIETRVDDFLLGKGYHKGVIPDNYIDVPPRSMDELKQNLRLLQDILNPKEDIHGVKEFIASLRNEIYPTIYEFLKNGKIALCEHFNQKEEDFSLAFISEVFEREKASLEPKIVMWIDGTIKDMEYLEAIIEAEENPKVGGGLELGPVPITGSLFSSLSLSLSHSFIRSFVLPSPHVAFCVPRFITIFFIDFMSS